jgi:hypothetical protein
MLISFLRFLTCCIFLGRAWQHWFWDIPMRELLWDEHLMTTPVKVLLGIDWETYISSMTVNAWMESMVSTVGFFYLGCSVAAIFVNKNRKWLGRLLIIGAVGLFLLAGLYWVEKFMKIGQWIEYSLQITTPVFLYYTIFKPQKDLTLWMKIAIALTFIGHGLYALGYYPVPAHFVQMMIDGFGINEASSMTFLKIVGIVDLIVAIGIFIPFLEKPSLIYCVVWGTMTAFARIIAHFDFDVPLLSLHQWLYEVLFRLVHGGIPLWVLWQSLTKKNIKD